MTLGFIKGAHISAYRFGCGTLRRPYEWLAIYVNAYGVMQYGFSGRGATRDQAVRKMWKNMHP